MTWRDFAPCVGMPETMHAADFTEALEVCDICPRWVRQACLTDARMTEQWGDECYGVRGGIPAHQRSRLPMSFRVPVIPRRFLPSTNPDMQVRTINGLCNPQPVHVDVDGFHVSRKAGHRWPGLAPCGTWGALKRHQNAGEVCDECRQWRADEKRRQRAS